jgi:Major tropism determinant N-terminal domain
MTTAVQVQYRRGTATQVAAFTGAQGELVVDTTNNRVVVQDGATAGGFPAAKLTDVGTITGLHGSTVQLGLIEDIITCSGASSVSTAAIPNRAIVLAVSVYVVTAIAGATSFNVDATTSASGGTGTTAGQFGSSLGIAAGSSNSGVIGPTAWYATSTVKLSAQGGSFTGGTVRVAIQYALCGAPTG